MNMDVSFEESREENNGGFSWTAQLDRAGVAESGERWRNGTHS